MRDLIWNVGYNYFFIDFHYVLEFTIKDKIKIDDFLNRFLFA